ncbi:two-component system response regulator [Anaerosporomusa subterranea]|jgi:two-component system KDP operon response regulator KdpE|uniref:Two-component system response regulator n=1 Tax=Anaerosporomusa subterranea TaxID=1794912 RepID=A0A154BNW7_ANASB|nr:response regulator [Anaerosporomusa subterranea]KYZ75703.1 two-component system response regulator [Anaerosporomusa subterranea]
MSASGYKVLIIDDDPPIRKLLKVSLGAHGYLLDEAACAQDGITRAAFFHPDIIILDLGLPDFDGKKAIKEIREWAKTPIIILTARDQEAEKIEALDAGADDYLTKPFGIGELLARMRVCLRRSSRADSEPIVQCGDLSVDFVQRRVLVGEREIKLTPTEYELVKILAQNAGRVMTHQQLLKAIWGNAYSEDTHYIRVYIGQLRRKIEPDPTQPRYIVTESGVGYRLLCQ